MESKSNKRYISKRSSSNKHSHTQESVLPSLTCLAKPFSSSPSSYFALYALLNTKFHIMPRTIHISYHCAFANILSLPNSLPSQSPWWTTYYSLIKTLVKQNLLEVDFIPLLFPDSAEFITSSLVLSLYHVCAYRFVVIAGVWAFVLLAGWLVVSEWVWLPYLFPPLGCLSCRQELCLNPPRYSPCPAQSQSQNKHLSELDRNWKWKQHHGELEEREASANVVKVYYRAIKQTVFS